MTEQLIPATRLATNAKTPFPGASAEYDAARKTLLAEEIEFRRHMTRLGEQRRALPPGPVISKNYRFKDEQAFEVGLQDLFGDKDTLVTYFWMFGPQRERPCPMCTNWLGSVNGNTADIKQRVALKILGRSSVERQYAFAQERGWRDLNFVQTIGDDYANDLARAGWKRVACAGRVQARRGQGPTVLGKRNDKRNGRPRPGPARCARHCVTLVRARSDAWGTWDRLVSEAQVLMTPTRQEGPGANHTGPDDGPAS